MRQPLIAGNWKMNGSLDSTRALLDAVCAKARTVAETVEVALLPPFVYLPETAAHLADSPVRWGAQNVSEHQSGAYTGEVSAAMLADFGCHYVLVGHSERRALYGETDELVAAKFAAAQTQNLQPILCVGETLDERDQDQTLAVVDRQLNAVLQHSGVASLQQAVIAYEPVWAIGTGRTATPEQAQEVHAYIRSIIAQHDATIASSVRILYGGSVKGSNAGTLLAMTDIDGGLVGGASLDASDFSAIIQAAA